MATGSARIETAAGKTPAAAEDPIADETRYACLARPWFAPARDPRREADERWRREWHGGWRGR